jgi:hypothetical protein
MFASVIIAVGLSLFVAEPESDHSEQLKAVRAMRALLKDEQYAAFYRDWCHPHIQKQVSEAQFTRDLKGAAGKQFVALFDAILDASKTSVDPKTLVARPQQKDDTYEFVLSRVRIEQIREKARQRKADAFWHLELKKHDNRWKLLDMD